MHDPVRFRRALAARILGLCGAASLAACQGGSARSTSGTTTTSTPSTTTTIAGDAGMGGVGGAGGASTGGGGMGGTSTGIQPVQSCFSLPIDAGADVVFDAGAIPGTCPADAPTALDDFKALGCPYGWEPYKIVSGPTIDAQGECCYMVLNTLCGPGGRPFVVGGEARVAAARRGGGVEAWGEGVGAGPCLDGLRAAERAALAAAWTADALFEHASVASFARFSLALMGAGAPAELVLLAHRAAVDEVRHARLCFALASAYAGEEVGPGAFPIGGEIRIEGGLAALAASTVAEGCVGETVSALLAAEQLAGATDPAVRAALEEIAEDEASHAELAWKTVAWAVKVGGDEVRAAVEEAFRGALAAGADGAGAVATDAEPRGHGRLDEATRARAVASAIEEVVAPGARALLGHRVQARRATSAHA